MIERDPQQTRHRSGGVIAVVGAGRVGTAIARAALATGSEVEFLSPGAPESTQLVLDFVAPGARAVDTTTDAVRRADLVILAIPLHRLRSLAPDLFAGSVVVDAMNYWPPVDGVIGELEEPGVTSSEMVAAHLRGARVVKTLNHIGYHDIEIDGMPAGSPGRRALAVASDDDAAAVRVAALLDRLGYDVERVPRLSEGWKLGTDAPIFGVRMTAEEVRRALDAGILAGKVD